MISIVTLNCCVFLSQAGQTALQIARENGFLEIAELLESRTTVSKTEKKLNRAKELMLICRLRLPLVLLSSALHIQNIGSDRYYKTIHKVEYL